MHSMIQCLIDATTKVPALRFDKVTGSWRVSHVCLMLLLCASGLSGCWLGSKPPPYSDSMSLSREERSTGDTIDDQLIHSTIKSKLIADPQVQGLQINVDVYKGYVTLKGYVRTEKELEHILLLTRETKGVRGVDSRIVLDR